MAFLIKFFNYKKRTFAYLTLPLFCLLLVSMFSTNFVFLSLTSCFNEEVGNVEWDNYFSTPIYQNLSEIEQNFLNFSSLSIPIDDSFEFIEFRSNFSKTEKIWVEVSENKTINQIFQLKKIILFPSTFFRKYCPMNLNNANKMVYIPHTLYNSSQLNNSGHINISLQISARSQLNNTLQHLSASVRLIYDFDYSENEIKKMEFYLSQFFDIQRSMILSYETFKLLNFTDDNYFSYADYDLYYTLLYVYSRDFIERLNPFRVSKLLETSDREVLEKIEVIKNPSSAIIEKMFLKNKINSFTIKLQQELNFFWIFLIYPFSLIFLLFNNLQISILQDFQHEIGVLLKRGSSNRQIFTYITILISVCDIFSIFLTIGIATYLIHVFDLSLEFLYYNALPYFVLLTILALLIQTYQLTKIITSVSKLTKEKKVKQINFNFIRFTLIYFFSLFLVSGLIEIFPINRNIILFRLLLLLFGVFIFSVSPLGKLYDFLGHQILFFIDKIELIYYECTLGVMNFIYFIKKNSNRILILTIFLLSIFVFYDLESVIGSINEDYKQYAILGDFIIDNVDDDVIYKISEFKDVSICTVIRIYKVYSSIFTESLGSTEGNLIAIDTTSFVKMVNNLTTSFDTNIVGVENSFFNFPNSIIIPKSLLSSMIYSVGNIISLQMSQAQPLFLNISFITEYLPYFFYFYPNSIITSINNSFLSNTTAEKELAIIKMNERARVKDIVNLINNDFPYIKIINKREIDTILPMLIDFRLFLSINRTIFEFFIILGVFLLFNKQDDLLLIYEKIGKHGGNYRAFLLYIFVILNLNLFFLIGWFILIGFLISVLFIEVLSILHYPLYIRNEMLFSAQLILNKVLLSSFLLIVINCAYIATALPKMIKK